MAKLSIFFLLCSISMALGNYYYYPGASAGALNYFPSYAQYGYAAPYAVVAAPEPDCDKKEKSSESSSSESSSEESSSSSESSEESGEKKEEKEGGEEGGEEKEEGEEKKEGEEKEEGSSSSSSSSSEESKESKEEKKEKKEKKEEKKKEKEEKSLFPPRTYSFPPVQQVVYAQPTYSYVPSYKTYSVIQQAPVSYTGKGAYMAAPYAAPAVKGYASPVTRIISAAPATARVVSVPAAKSYSAYSSYLSPTSGVLGMPSYLGNNVAYYKA